MNQDLVQFKSLAFDINLIDKKARQLYLHEIKGLSVVKRLVTDPFDLHMHLKHCVCMTGIPFQLMHLLNCLPNNLQFI